eukprot:289929_1
MAQSQNRPLKIVNIPFKSTKITEINRTLDLSFIVDNMDRYSKGKQVHTDGYFLDDLEFSVSCYPKGKNSTTDQNSIALFIGFDPCANNDYRKAYITAEHGGKTQTFANTINNFQNGRGWVRFATHATLKQYPKIDIKITLHHGPAMPPRLCQTFTEQHKIMHRLSELNGDVTLAIQLPPQDDAPQSPPRKKRKLNDDHQCSVCNKEFQSQKALTSHQSSKKDEAHQEYRDNANIDMDTGLDCTDNEIKVSSLILRSASKVFDRMLTTDMKEKEEKRIEIHAQSVDDVKAMLYFMSTNVLKSDCNAFNVIGLAHYYELNRLFTECINRIISNISIQHFAQSINIFDKFEIEDGYDCLVQFAKQNLDELQKEPDFDTIPHSFKCLVFKRK